MTSDPGARMTSFVRAAPAVVKCGSVYIRPRAQHKVTGRNIRLQVMNKYKRLKKKRKKERKKMIVQSGQMVARWEVRNGNLRRLLVLVFLHQLHPGWVATLITVSVHYSNRRRCDIKKCTASFFFESLAFQLLSYPKRNRRTSFDISQCSFCLVQTR